MYIKVKDTNDLVRDDVSKAILNTDNDALLAYKQRRQKDKAFEQLCANYAELQSEVSEIKQLLRAIVKKNNI